MSSVSELDAHSIPKRRSSLPPGVLSLGSSLAKSSLFKSARRPCPSPSPATGSGTLPSAMPVSRRLRIFFAFHDPDTLLFPAPYLVNTAPGSAGLEVKVFFIWGSTCACCMIFTYFCVPEVSPLHRNSPSAFLISSLSPRPRAFRSSRSTRCTSTLSPPSRTSTAAASRLVRTSTGARRRAPTRFTRRLKKYLSLLSTSFHTLTLLTSVLYHFLLFHFHLEIMVVGCTPTLLQQEFPVYYRSTALLDNIYKKFTSQTHPSRQISSSL